MDAPEIRRRPEPPGGAVGLVNECAKEARPDVSYIDRAPEKQVVLSPRLEHLARQVGGCQTEEVLALVRGIMYEVISQRKVQYEGVLQERIDHFSA